MSEARSRTIPVSVIQRRRPGVTRWAAVSWGVAGIVPGGVAFPTGDILRQDGEVVDVHGGTASLTLWRTDTEAYLTALNGRPPSVFVILRRRPGSPLETRPELLSVTASAYEAQDHSDNGEDIVEKVAMEAGLEAWVREFVDRHHEEEPFRKRRRVPHADPVQEGGGDPRIRKTADVYLAPGLVRRGPP